MYVYNSVNYRSNTSVITDIHQYKHAFMSDNLMKRCDSKMITNGLFQTSQGRHKWGGMPHPSFGLGKGGRVSFVPSIFFNQTMFILIHNILG